MITAIVQFALPEPLLRTQALQMFRDSAPKYRKVRGLIRKYYLLGTDGRSAGGVYLFESREDADRLYTPEWKGYIEGKYGGSPSIAYFDAPVIVDNLAGQVIEDPA